MSYAGDVTCEDCWEALGAKRDSQLLDVRSAAEWAFVGYPALETLDKNLLLVEWQQFPHMQINPNFVEQTSTRLQTAGADAGSDIFTLCRSGARSISAAQALTAAGFKNVYNVLCGFEGASDGHGHRGTVSGWKFDGLPWVQQ